MHSCSKQVPGEPIILSLGMLWECSKKASIPSCEMCVVSFLFITSRATGTGMLVIVH